MSRLFPLACTLSLLVALVGCSQQRAHFGEPMTMENQKAYTVAEVMAAPEKYEGKEIRVVGDIEAMCVHSGCWVELKDDDAEHPLFVEFTFDPETGRVPPEAMGHHAACEGTLVIKDLSDEHKEHLRKEFGMTDDELHAKRVRLACRSAAIEGVEVAAPKACEHDE